LLQGKRKGIKKYSSYSVKNLCGNVMSPQGFPAKNILGKTTFGKNAFVQLCAFFAFFLCGKKNSFVQKNFLSCKKNRCFFVAKAFPSLS
jgi:hypothetical protein